MRREAGRFAFAPARYRSAALWVAALAFCAVLAVFALNEPLPEPRPRADTGRAVSRSIEQPATDASNVIVPRPGDTDSRGIVILRPELPPEAERPPVPPIAHQR